LKIFISKVFFFKIKLKRKDFEQVIQFCDTGGNGRLKLERITKLV